MSDEDKPKGPRGFDPSSLDAMAKGLREPMGLQGKLPAQIKHRRRIMKAVAERPIGALPPQGLFNDATVPDCPICRNGTWEIRGPANLQEGEFFEPTANGQIWNETTGQGRSQVLAVIAFICARCGFIRHHATDKYEGVL